MATVTGYALYDDIGDAGPSTGDGVSGGSFPSDFDTNNYTPTGTAVIDYPEIGPVTGTFYLVDGTYYFVPDDPAPFPLSQPGTIQSYESSSSGDGNVYGTGGNDASGDFATTSGNDTIYGGSDTSSTGTGNDTINGGGGDDVIYAGDGDDSIVAGDGNDTVYAGDGNDYVDGWTGNDSIEGGDGSDTILAYDGQDTVHGGAGNDHVYGEAGDDSIHGDGGDDTLQGGTGADTIYGDAGHDFIFGEGGNDELYGGTGNDTLSGGTGNDSLTGGAGDDTFQYSVGDGHDTIADFNTGNTGSLDDGDATNNDFIDLSNFYDDISELYADQADDGILNQSNSGVDYSDNDQFGDGSLTFEGASADESFYTQENTGVVCFAGGTLIRTPDGDVPIETLQAGDLAETLDHGPQMIRWIGQRHVSREELKAEKRLRPIRIQKGVLGNDRTLLISRQHGMLVGNGRFARAVHLAKAMRGIGPMDEPGPVTYYHLLFDTHEIVFAEGIPSESFYPGPVAFSMMGAASIKDVRELVPNLPDDVSRVDQIIEAYGPTARMFLSRKEVLAWAEQKLVAS